MIYYCYYSTCQCMKNVVHNTQSLYWYKYESKSSDARWESSNFIIHQGYYTVSMLKFWLSNTMSWQRVHSFYVFPTFHKEETSVVASFPCWIKNFTFDKWVLPTISDHGSKSDHIQRLYAFQPREQFVNCNNKKQWFPPIWIFLKKLWTYLIIGLTCKSWFNP
jgi:hypothetical protein